MLNPTHDPARTLWIDSANQTGADFPLQNLPFGVFRTVETPAPRIGVAIGDQILDLSAAAGLDLLPATARPVCQQATLNPLMAAGPAVWTVLRARLSELLGADSCPTALRAQVQHCLVPQSAAMMQLPSVIGDYTDFYASIFHATNVGKLFRPDQPLLPNYKWVPIGYHGRASSIGVSGQAFHRPVGQTKALEADVPSVGPTRRLDYELELALFVATPNALGEPVPMAQAEDHLFGLALFNDWSARDVQAWEYQPLGPFLAKSFASTLSPWVVTLDALQPFRVPPQRAPGDPPPLPYLDTPANRAAGAIDLQLEVLIETRAMRDAGLPPQRLACSNFRDAYWTAAQLLTHHTMNGCNLRSGDVLGTGTLSGAAANQAGSLLELSVGGSQPARLAHGETRSFLEDGDCVVLRGWCDAPGARRIGFGECRGTVLPARGWPPPPLTSG